jgi:leucyl/phenylalanyl-tRNA--protein transferase
MVLYPEEIRISRSLRKRLRQGHFRVTADTAMEAVIDGCAAPRAGTDDTWIGSDMRKAYLELHRQGYVHSIETWLEGELVGGLYGLCLGRVFFGESMFSRSTDASKVALVHLSNQLREWGFAVIDCQQETPHLQSMGARNITREEFLVILDAACDDEGMHSNRWTMDWTYTEDEWGNQRRF